MRQEPREPDARILTRDAQRFEIDSCGRTDRGTGRVDNEDHFLVAEMWQLLAIGQCTLPASFERQGESVHAGDLYAIADGMGGHIDGERASRAALEALENNLLFELSSAGDIGLALQDVFRRCEERVQAIDIGDAIGRPPGTTLTAALVIGNRSYITHVGDSRAYLIRGGRSIQLTADHTVGEWLKREGLGDDAVGRYHGALVNAIGGGTERATIDATGLELNRNDALVLCSDGLTRSVDNQEIADVVSDSTQASEACDRLLSLALERDGTDNITVVIARVLD